jgi:hypothetical protein
MNLIIEDTLLKEFEDISRETKATPLDLIKKALEDYVYLFKVNKVRSKLEGIAEKSGYKTEEELLYGSK